MSPLTIVKIGGKLLDDELKWNQVITSFSKIETKKILIHGGGQIASKLCLKLGIEPQIVNGRRITDQGTLYVVTMVYAGLINKKLVSSLQNQDCNAIGLSGADGNLIIARKRTSKETDFGFVGDIEHINTELLIMMLEQGITPVICAITHNKCGQLLNTNADTIASVLASELSKYFRTMLKFCFEKEGVLADPLNELSVIPCLSKKEYKRYRKNGSISEGMIPKLDNAFDAKKCKVHKVIVCGINGILNQEGTEICL